MGNQIHAQLFHALVGEHYHLRLSKNTDCWLLIIDYSLLIIVGYKGGKRLTKATPGQGTIASILSRRSSLLTPTTGSPQKTAATGLCLRLMSPHPGCTISGGSSPDDLRVSHSCPADASRMSRIL